MTKRRKDGAFHHTYGPEFIRVSSMDCCVCGKRGWWAHHLKTVGSGGRDQGNLVPLCVEHHSEIERVGRLTFEDRHHIFLSEVAKQVANAD